MPAIISTGAYIPYYRLKREEIVRAWGGAQRGEKAVANFDEDSVTMAVEAGRDALHGIDRQTIDGLYFATTTAPYKEKQGAAVIASALNLKKGVFAVDFTDTLRAGTNALRAAVDAVKAGSAQRVLVVAADCRLGAPGSEFEQVFGDGAAALVIGKEGSIDLVSSYTHTSEIIDQWRLDSHAFTKKWEDRFVATQGYLANVSEAVGAFMKQQNTSLKDFNKVALYAPDARGHQEACRMLKLDIKTQVTNPMFDTVGNTGAAFALLILVAAVEEANTDDKLLLVSYGDGCDIFTFHVKEKPAMDKERRGVQGYLKAKNYLSNYEKYIRFRKLMEVESGRRRPPQVSSAVVIHRDRRMIYSLNGSECTSCGRAFFPPQRICLYCQAKDQFREISLTERKGKLFTFSKDELAQSLDPPVIVSIVDLEGNLRFYGQMTDRDPDKVELDMPLDLTFRKMGEAEGYYSYFWKCRPVR
ncbi:MAG: zinc ribbon domain-containing protein [Syntrophales bacterium]|nr:zinc ribbon domain-containing protein [Syntrophales bacterium]